MCTFSFRDHFSFPKQLCQSALPGVQECCRSSLCILYMTFSLVSCVPFHSVKGVFLINRSSSFESSPAYQSFTRWIVLLLSCLRKLSQPSFRTVISYIVFQTSILLPFTFTLTVCLELIFVCGMRKGQFYRLKKVLFQVFFCSSLLLVDNNTVVFSHWNTQTHLPYSF